MLATAGTLAGKLQQFANTPSKPIEFTVPITEINIAGWLDSLYGCGRISIRPATCKAKDLLRLWIHHLILCRIRPRGIDPVSTHIGTDATITLRPVDNPRAELKTLSEYFLRGMSEPLHFYPEISYIFATAKTESSGIKGAYRRWYSGYFSGEEEDSAYGIALRGQDPLDEQFLELAAIFHPVLAVMEREDAAA
jgi:exodeoxyribonuclease V gamma subunit